MCCPFGMSILYPTILGKGFCKVYIYIYRDIIYLYYSQFTSAQKGAMQITIC